MIAERMCLYSISDFGATVVTSPRIMSTRHDNRRDKRTTKTAACEPPLLGFFAVFVLLKSSAAS
jgi:hypothetical protein